MCVWVGRGVREREKERENAKLDLFMTAENGDFSKNYSLDVMIDLRSCCLIGSLTIDAKLLVSNSS